MPDTLPVTMDGAIYREGTATNTTGTGMCIIMWERKIEGGREGEREGERKRGREREICVCVGGGGGGYCLV